MTLIEFITDLFGDDRMQLRDSFQKDPQAVLAQYGFGHLTVEDVGDAMVLVRDNDTVGFHQQDGPEWTGEERFASAITEQWREHSTTDVAGVETTTDQPADHVPRPPGEFGQSSADRSVNATGDGAVVAGGDITGSTITYGDGSPSGGGNSTAFGHGDAVREVDVRGVDVSPTGREPADPATDSPNQTFGFDDATTHPDMSIQDNVVPADDHPSHMDVASHDDVGLHFG